ncbi:MAG: hypothetical protein AMS23_06005, partial [Bacteroides sp. SM1_62]
MCTAEFYTKISESTAGRNIILPYSVDLDKAFVLIYPNSPAYTYVSDLMIAAELTSSNTLSLSRFGSTQSLATDVAWYVVEFRTDDVKVQGGTTLLASGEGVSPTPKTQAITSINPAKSFVSITSKGSGNGSNFIDGMVRAEITNNTTLSFTRKGGATACTVAWFVVEFFDTSYSQRGAANNWTTGTVSPTFSSIATNRAFPIVSVNNSTAEAIYNHQTAADIASATDVDLYRYGSASADYGWFVVELPSLRLNSPDGGTEEQAYADREVWVVGQQKYITWSYANTLKSGGGGTGGVHRVKLEVLSPQDGVTWLQIPGASALDVDTGTLDNQHSYLWTIPPSITQGTTHNLIGENLKIRITDIDDTTTRNFDTSNNVFIVKGSLTIDQPPSMEPNIWKIGEAKQISWTNTGDLYNIGGAGATAMTIKLSTDGGANYYHTITSTANPGTDSGSGGTGNFLWTIPADIQADDPVNPNLIGTDNRLKLILNYDPNPPSTTVESESANFTIKGRISNVTLSTTVPADTYYYGGSYTISWDKYGHFGTGTNDGTVDIKYSNNGGLSFGTTIQANVAAGTHGVGGSYPWTVDFSLPASTETDPPPGNSVIKVEQSGVSEVSDVSTNIYVGHGDITVNSPDGGTFYVGEPMSIDWSVTGNYTNVKIWLSRDNGGNWVLLKEVAAGSFPDSWDVEPPLCANQGLVRVESSDYPTKVYGQSPTAFTIAADINVVEPDGVGDIWKVGEDRDIVWNYTGTLGDVNIKVSRNSGGNWSDIATVAADYVEPADPTKYGTDSYYTWTVTGPEAEDSALIRVESATYPNYIAGESGATFTIQETISVTNPSGANVVWRVNTPKTIEWQIEGQPLSGPGGVEYVDIHYNALGTWEIIKLDEPTPACGTSTCTYSYGPWGVADAISENAQIRVQDSLANEIYGLSTTFKIKAFIDVYQPAADDILIVDQQTQIKWTVDGTYADPQPTVYARVSTTGGASYGDPVGSADINAGQINWTPTSTHVDKNCKVRVGFGAVNPGEDTITGTAGESGIFYVGRITVTGESNGDGSPVWEIGTPEYITWDVQSPVGTVDLYYSKNDGIDWDYVRDSEDTPVTVDCPSTGSYNYLWSPIPNNVIDTDKNIQIKFKIESPSMGLSGISQNPLTIRKRYDNVSVPSSTLFVGDNSVLLSNITWDTYGVTPPPSTIQVLLNYDTNSGLGDDGTSPSPDDYEDTINNGNPITDTGGFVWNVPDEIGENVRIRVKSNEYPDEIYEDMTDDFVIKGKINPTYPTGSDTLVVGLPVTGGIQYQKKGTIGNLKIEYIHSGNATVITPEPAGTPNATSFSWSPIATDSGGQNVIDTSGSKNSKFRFIGLLHEGDPVLEVVQESDDFQIRGDIYDIVPAGGGVPQQSFGIGATTYIKWKTRGDVGNVRIRLDLNEGLGPDGNPNTGDEFLNQVTGPAAPPYNSGEVVEYNYDGGCGLTDCTGCWQWTVPTSVSNKARIRVESRDNPASIPPAAMDTYGISAGNFTITGSVTVIKPNGPQTPHWKADDQDRLIEWSKQGDVGNVSITLYYELDTDDGIPPYDQSLPIASGLSGASYPWDIPSTLSTEHAIITITSDSYPEITDDSDAEFKIKPVLILTDPINNNNPWVVGDISRKIIWDPPKGTANFLKINVSTDGGTTWTDTSPPTLAAKGGLIATDVDVTAGEYPLTGGIPDIMTNQAKIRIQKVGDTETNDYSDVYFYIKGSLSNIHIKNNVGDPDPATPIDLPIGSTKYITWNYTGSMGTANLFYCTDADQPTPTWNPIAACTGVSIGSGGSGSCAWNIPYAASPNYVKVMVANVHDDNWPDVSNTSSYINNIIGSIQDVTVKASGTPSTTDMEVGSTKYIRWKPNDVSTVMIEYRYDGGGWIEITPTGGVSGVDDGDGYRAWEWTGNPPGSGIPDTISNDVDFRVSDYGQPNKVNVTSITDYIIKGQLYLLIPDSSVTWTVGENNPAVNRIRWEKYGDIGDLKIEFSASGTFDPIDYTNGYVLTIESSLDPGSDGINDYTWPSGIVGANRRITESGRIRISNITTITGTELTDASTQTFKIRPKITGYNSPQLNDLWMVEDPNQTITWTASSGTDKDGNYPKVVVNYKIGAGSDNPISGEINCTNGTNNFPWTAGVADEMSAAVKIHVYFVNHSTDRDLESDPFEIRPEIILDPSIDADTRIYAFSNNPNFVKWSYTGTKLSTRTVNIYYDLNGGLGPNGVEDGRPPAGDDYQGTIALNRPMNAGAAGVTWDASALDVDDNVSIRVVDSAASNIKDDSESFKIIGKITVISPSGSDTTLTASSSQTIQWDFEGTIDQVNIYYNLTGGTGNWTPILPVSLYDQTGSSGSPTISWTLPSTVSNNAVIKVAEVGNEDEVFGITADPFRIGAQFQVTAPINGAPVYAEDDDTWITWNTLQGTGIGKVHLYYSNNSEEGEPDWIQITPDGGITNTGSYRWGTDATSGTVPGALADISSLDHRVMVTQFDPENEADVNAIGTGAQFPLVCSLEVTQPNGHEWTVGNPYTIKFTKKGELQSVNIYYSYDGDPAHDVKLNSTARDISGAPDDGGTGEYFFPWTPDSATLTLSQGKTAVIRVKAVTPAVQASPLLVQDASNGFQLKG